MARFPYLGFPFQYPYYRYHTQNQYYNYNHSEKDNKQNDGLNNNNSQSNNFQNSGNINTEETSSPVENRSNLLNTRKVSSSKNNTFSLPFTFDFSGLSDPDSPILELFGIRLYLDDIIILCLLFLLYKEDVKDEMLFIALILLLLG